MGDLVKFRSWAIWERPEVRGVEKSRYRCADGEKRADIIASIGYP